MRENVREREREREIIMCSGSKSAAVSYAKKMRKR